MIILDLCGGTGAWSKPYADAGYDVRLVTLPEQDVRTYVPPENVHGILAAPPCTEFAVSGAKWWATKPKRLLSEAVEVWAACMRIITAAAPSWWALENPVGRLRRWAGPPAWSFQPWEYGDRQFKRTLIWGTAKRPAPTVTKEPKRTNANQSVWRAAPSPERAALRSVTMPGFARAFFEANP
jgi:site-specific DNA-cytosine methylase